LEAARLLNHLGLRNYRGFEDHELELKPFSVMVGQNNAGKSTIVEALRVISIITQRTAGLAFRPPPMWSEVSIRLRGVTPSLDGFGIEFSSICHRYDDPPASVVATFVGGERIECLLSSSGEAFEVLYDADGNPISSKGQMRSVRFPRVDILPQISPLEPHESILSEDYVSRRMSSPLASRHFRNQLRLDASAYREFRRLAENTWPGLQVRTLEGARGEQGEELFLDVRDNDFVAEVGRMGHGLQMWLQMMWFLSRTPNEASVVLDEPDVYMHPDLQRRVVRLIRDRYSQVIIATHSVEIMAEVDHSEILVIDRKEATSRFATSDPEVQGLVERLGGVHNLQLARLWTAKRCLFVEGKDVRYLRLVHDLLFPEEQVALDEIPNMDIGGWGGWPYAVGSSLFIRNSVGEGVSVYCIFDSDFHTDDEVNQRLEEAKSKRVRLHIWRRKEIENYFLLSGPISRAINAAKRDNAESAPEAVVRENLLGVASDLRNETQDNLAEEIYLKNRGRGFKAANQEARAIVNEAFSTSEGALAAVSGKAVLGKLGTWSQTTFGSTLGVAAIARSMTVSDIPAEMKAVVKAIHSDQPFKRTSWRRAWVGE
jgi:predicted ATPase